MLHTPDVVLIVDPDPVSRSTLSQVLTLHGYAVIVADNFTLARHHLEEKSVDLMLFPLDDHFSLTEDSFLQTARAMQPTLQVIGICTDDVSKDVLSAVDDFIRLPHPAQSLKYGTSQSDDRTDVVLH